MSTENHENHSYFKYPVLNSLYASIQGIQYTPFLCKKLKVYDHLDIQQILLDKQEASFILKTQTYTLAISRWVSPKRTRTYPYARVYNTLNFSGKKITIIPLLKDEGKEGARDFLHLNNGTRFL